MQESYPVLSSGMDIPLDPPGPGQAASPSPWATARRWAGRAGLVGVLCVLANLAMTRWASSRGIHCPDCDRLVLGSEVGWWESFWLVKQSLLALGAGLGLVALAMGKPRWIGAVALFAAATIRLYLTPR
jgi:hypothetical protein